MTAIPRDVVVYDRPGVYDLYYPSWARWAIVTVRGADGGLDEGQQERKPGAKLSQVVLVDVPSVRVILGEAGRDFDGVRRGRNAYCLVELFEEDPR